MKKQIVLLAFLLLGVSQISIHKGHGVWWDDLRFPAGVAGRGGSAPADIDSAMGYLRFGNSVDEDGFYWPQMPHGYIFGTDLHPHIHWAKSTSAAGTVCFKLSYECADIGETFTNSFVATIEFSTINVPDSDTAFKHAMREAPSFNPSFDIVSGMCGMRLWRDVSGDGACTDTYAADAIVYEFDIHFQTDQPGSYNELSKY